MNKFVFIFGFLVIGAAGEALFAGPKGQSTRQKTKKMTKSKSAITHYTTGPLTKNSVEIVLELIEQLKKYVSSGFSPWNLMRGQKLRKKLSNDYKLNDVTTIEQLVKANALIMMSSDDAIFLVSKEYRELLQDCFPDIVFEEGKIALLPGNCEEVKEFVRDLEACYQAEHVRDIEQHRADELKETRSKLEDEEKGLVFKAKELDKRVKELGKKVKELDKKTEL